MTINFSSYHWISLLLTAHSRVMIGFLAAWNAAERDSSHCDEVEFSSILSMYVLDFFETAIFDKKNTDCLAWFD